MLLSKVKFIEGSSLLLTVVIKGVGHKAKGARRKSLERKAESKKKAVFIPFFQGNQQSPGVQ